ncbi:MAG: hypothetical protein II905_00595 [Muribaculaceae bacterium]|nr:hypothetical protein [Muribaculaceae bacterium]
MMAVTERQRPVENGHCGVKRTGSLGGLSYADRPPSVALCEVAQAARERCV